MSTVSSVTKGRIPLRASRLSPSWAVGPRIPAFGATSRRPFIRRCPPMVFEADDLGGVLRILVPIVFIFGEDAASVEPDRVALFDAVATALSYTSPGISNEVSKSSSIQGTSFLRPTGDLANVSVRRAGALARALNDHGVAARRISAGVRSGRESHSRVPFPTPARRRERHFVPKLGPLGDGQRTANGHAHGIQSSLDDHVRRPRGASTHLFRAACIHVDCVGAHVGGNRRLSQTGAQSGPFQPHPNRRRAIPQRNRFRAAGRGPGLPQPH